MHSKLKLLSILAIVAMIDEGAVICVCGECTVKILTSLIWGVPAPTHVGKPDSCPMRPERVPVPVRN
jgi:hypothetical protein